MNVNNGTPIHDAAWNSSTKIAKLLLERGAEIEARDENNGTPLHYAKEKNSKETAQLSLEHDA